MEFQPLYRSYGTGLTTWSPLASGVLTGKYSKDNVPPDSRFALETYKNLATRSLVDEVLGKVEALRPLAKQLDVTMAQLAIAWCIKNPHVTSVITGATKESQVGMDGGEKQEPQIRSKPTVLFLRPCFLCKLVFAFVCLFVGFSRRQE